MNTVNSIEGSFLDIGSRLRKERERLGYSQPGFGEIGGVKKLAQINYEKADRYPDAVYLARIAEAGADVLYIITGQRSQKDASATLPPDESLLLEAYRGLKPAKRKALLAELLTGKKAKDSSGGISVKGSGHRVAGGDYNEGKK
ncbi:helix-turn-helix domain-containing protein [Marinobacter shengliensis]